MNNDFIMSEDILYKYVGNSREVIIPEKIKIIYKEAFDGNESVEKIVMPNELEIIEDYAFAGCVNLKSVMFNKQLKYIGEQAFSGCEKISEIDLPDSISYMGEDCLFETNITEIILPAGLIKIDFECIYGLKIPGAFRLNEPLAHIGVSKNSPYYIEVDNCIFSKNMKRLYSMTIDAQEKIAIPEGTEFIGPHFLHIRGNERQINELVLPHSLKYMAFDSLYMAPIKRIVIKKGLATSFTIWCACFDEIIIPENVTMIKFDGFGYREIDNRKIYLLNPETSIEFVGNTKSKYSYMVYSPKSEIIKKYVGSKHYAILSDEELIKLKQLTED